MADRLKKETTPPPPLLLMPAGGGLTLNPPEQQNVLMPVIQSEPSLLGPDDEAEADSFVGQSPPVGTAQTSSHISSPFSMFQQQPLGSDPFAQVGHGPPPQFVGQQEPSTMPKQPDSASTSRLPISATALPQLQGTSNTGPSPPPSGAGPAMNVYRMQGAPKYAQPPSGTYASPEPVQTATSFPPNMPPPNSNLNLEGIAVSKTPSLPSAGSFPPNIPAGPPTQLPPKSYVSHPPGLGMYTPIQPLWCFQKKIENKDQWLPFSLADSLRLEEVFNTVQQNPENSIVATDGGRYDVNLNAMLRTAIYWEEEPNSVRRSTWFYKREGDNKYVPYAERFAQKLEEEYKNAIVNNIWHKRLDFPGGETIVMHNPNVIVHFQPSSQPDEWGTVQPTEHTDVRLGGIKSVYTLPGDHMRPRVVKRGYEDFETIKDGETGQIDHLVFVIHGIGAICDIRFRNVVECVDDFRTISQSLLQSHFKQPLDEGRIGRVEFLPVHWHKTLHGDATGIDRRVKAITLPSTVKLRHFVNDTLLDILFYTSPKYCQTMADTVGSEINRLYHLFLGRNPNFSGSVSLAGHSLGSCILFDLLLHQHDHLGGPDEDAEVIQSAANSSLKNVELPPVENMADNQLDMTLEELLARVGLQGRLHIFEQEQFDMDSLIMVSDADLKDLGLPMGPRKKLQGLLREELEKKECKKQAAELKAKLELEREAKGKQQQQQEEEAAEKSEQEKLNHHTSSVSVDYLVGLAGTGQPSVQYPQIDFQPVNLFALGSPIGVFLAARGVDNVGEEFSLHACPRFFNIFHPFDPVAYRLEPLVNPQASSIKPVLMPHHKGRKRMHLELRESLTRVGADIKDKIIKSLKSTWNSINEFARAHRTQTFEQEVNKEVDEVITQLTQHGDLTDTESIASSHEEEISMGQLNEGRRIDYVLQEKPIESFNDYLFALASHGCYWESEDTVLMVLKEIYSLSGVKPQMPGPELYQRALYMGPQRPQLPLQTAQVSPPAPVNFNGQPGSPSGGQPMGIGAPPLSGFVRQ